MCYNIVTIEYRKGLVLFRVMTNDLEEFEVRDAQVNGRTLNISISGSYQDAVNAFKEAKSVKLYQGNVLVGEYPHVRFMLASAGLYPEMDEGYFVDEDAEPVEVAVASLYIPTSEEIAIAKLQETQLEQDIAIAEIYGGGY